MNQFYFRVWDGRNKCFIKSPNFSACKEGEQGGAFIVSSKNLIVQLSVGKLDKRNKWIFQGDFVKFHNKGLYTQKEYWNPIYEVTWNGFSFGLKHLGGGVRGDNNLFNFEHRAFEFEVIGNIFEDTIIVPKVFDNGFD
jgi:hypothetical protein